MIGARRPAPPHASGTADGERVRARARSAAAWAEEQGLFAGAPELCERASVNAATYASLCAPTGATERQLALATTFTVVFFWLDDAEPGHVAELVALPWPAALEQLPALAGWRADATELDDCAPALHQAWLTSLRIWLVALVDETAIDPRHVTVAEQLALRRRNAFIDPYLDLWLALLDAPPPVDACVRARWLARELIVLANDLGSLERDLAAVERPELNLVITLARERGLTHAEATAELVEQHDGLAAELAELLPPVIAAGGARWAELVRQVVIGNVAAMRALAERYPGSAALLDALRLPR